MDLSRRQLLTLGGLTAAGATVAPSQVRAQTPKRGGTLAVRLWDPPHFDLHAAGISYKLHTLMSFTHSRLVRHGGGPRLQPGTFPLEGDLAESWSQPNETTYVFKLRRGVRWHPKPPVNGRELTADDVIYTIDRFLTTKGHANAHMLKAVDKVEAVDKHTVKFTLKEPYAWFLDTLASPMVVAIVAKDSSDKFGDLKKPESFIGTGPWMLDSYRPNQGADARAQPPVLRRRPALHRPRRDHHRRGQRLAHRLVPGRQVRPRLGESRHHQPHRLGPDPGSAQAEAAGAPDGRVPVQRHVAHLLADGPEALQRRPRPAGDLPTPSTGRASSTRPPRASASTTPRSRRRSRTGRSPSTSSARARSTSSTIPPRPSGSWRPPAIRTGSRRAPASRRTARPSSSTPCSSCSRT